MSNRNNRYDNYKKYLNKKVQKQEYCCVPGPAGPRGPPGEKADERLASIAIEPWSPPGYAPVWNFPKTYACPVAPGSNLSLYQQFHAHGGLYRNIQMVISQKVLIFRVLSYG